MLRLRLSIGFVVAFLALNFLLGELHEVVHTGVGWLFCRGWGPRDFNVWSLAEGCSSARIFYLPTYAGPAFTFAVMWLGAWMLLRSDRAAVRSLGFCMIFANMPIGRLATAAMGAGDEVFATRHVLGSRPLGVAIGLTAVVLLSLPPLVVAWRSIANRHRWAWFAGFFTLPLLLAYLVVFRGLNPLLERGVMAAPWMPYAPGLITFWTLMLVAVLAGCWGWLLRADGERARPRDLRR